VTPHWPRYPRQAPAKYVSTQVKMLPKGQRK
jgi:hypothetical protein